MSVVFLTNASQNGSWMMCAACISNILYLCRILFRANGCDVLLRACEQAILYFRMNGLQFPVYFAPTVGALCKSKPMSISQQVHRSWVVSACPNDQNMYPDWYFLTILTGTSTCHECKACIVDTCGGARSLVKHNAP